MMDANVGKEKDILDKFIANAKLSIDEGYYREASKGKFDGGRISFRKKLDSQGFCLITEIKHASPAGEYSFAGIDAEKTAHEFRRCGADAISCVVEPKIFNGKLENVAQAKRAGLPVLFKDFVMCEEQIKAASALGADVILLVVKVAERENLDLARLISLAHQHNLEVLLETYDADEMRLAMETEADILGINNRDLRTLKVDLNRTAEILKAIGGAENAGKPVISESGIKDAQGVRFVRQFGVKGALVGTAIWKADNLGEKVKELKSGALP